MSEAAAIRNTPRISICRTVHLAVRILFTINVAIFSTSFSTRLSQAFMSSYLAMPLVQLSVVSSFILPIIAILEAVMLHRHSSESRRNAVVDIVITSLWALGMVGWSLYSLTHFVVL
jgi:hypothetical protein